MLIWKGNRKNNDLLKNISDHEPYGTILYLPLYEIVNCFQLYDIHGFQEDFERFLQRRKRRRFN